MKYIPYVKIVSITADEAEQRIDNFLLTKLKGLPYSMIYRILRKGEVRVNKKRIKPEYKLQSGDKVRIPPVRILSRGENTVLPHIQKKIKYLTSFILCEDDHLIVLNKPSGTAVHGGSGLKFGIIEGLRALRPEANFLELVHRLDKDTSGVLLIAKKHSALRYLHEQLRTNCMHKVYLALVNGHWPSNIKIIQAPLKTIKQNCERIVRVSRDGKPSETRFNIEERYAFATLVRCSPITGRTHQIRVHTQHAGHSIAFDNRYGNRYFDQKLICTKLSRLFLHAAFIKFEHPSTGEIMQIEAPMDDELKYCLKILRKSYFQQKS